MKHLGTRLLGAYPGTPASIERRTDELRDLAAEVSSRPTRNDAPRGDSPPNIEDYVGPYVTLRRDWRRESNRVIADVVCPWESEHSEGAGNVSSTSVWQFVDTDGSGGGYAFRCQHAQCSNQGWKDFKRAVGIPESRPLVTSQSSNAARGSPATGALSPGPNALARYAAPWSVGRRIGLRRRYKQTFVHRPDVPRRPGRIGAARSGETAYYG